MLTHKYLFICTLLCISFLLCPVFAHSEGHMLTDEQLDQVQAGLSFEEGIDEILNEVLSLAFNAQAQTDTHAISNVNLVNSAVVIQSNITLLINTSGDISQLNISQINTADVINK